MNKLVIFFLFGCFIILSCNKHKGSVEGNLYDIGNGKLITNASIAVEMENYKAGTTTFSKNGHYKIEYKIFDGDDFRINTNSLNQHDPSNPNPEWIYDGRFQPGEAYPVVKGGGEHYIDLWYGRESSIDTVSFEMKNPFTIPQTLHISFKDSVYYNSEYFDIKNFTGNKYTYIRPGPPYTPLRFLAESYYYIKVQGDNNYIYNDSVYIPYVKKNGSLKIVIP